MATGVRRRDECYADGYQTTILKRFCNRAEMTIGIQFAMFPVLRIWPPISYAESSVCIHSIVSTCMRRTHRIVNLINNAIKQVRMDEHQRNERAENHAIGAHEHPYRTSPGCAGFVVFGCTIYGAGNAIPAGCAGMTSSGAFAYFGLTNAYIPTSPSTHRAVPPMAQT